jgi:hypothetical protein
MSKTTNMNMSIPALGNKVTDDIPAMGVNFQTIDTEFGQRGINVKWFGAKGDGVTNDTAAIQSAINAATSTKEIVFPAGSYLIASNITFPSGITLYFLNGAVLLPNSGVTVTLNCNVKAGLYTIFAGSGTYVGPLQVEKVYPQWFGASGSSQTTTGSINAGSNVLTLTSALDFQNNQQVAIPGAGTPCSLATPSAPTVTPMGTTGTATYQYQIAALDANGGVSPVSQVTTISNGSSVLTNGLGDPVIPLVLSASGSGSSLSAATYYVAYDFRTSIGQTKVGGQSSITVTAGQNITTTITVPQLATSVGIYVGTSSNPLLLGTISNAATPVITYSGGLSSGLSATVTNTAANGGTRTISITISAPASGTGASGASSNTTQAYNAISWNAVPNAIGYAIYGNTSGNNKLLFVTPNTSWNDFGVTPGHFPGWKFVPQSPSTTGMGGTLLATILSGGGTTSLTLSANAGSSVANGTVYHDDTKAFNNAMGVCGLQSNVLHIPKGSYIISSTIINNASIVEGDGVSGTTIYFNPNAYFPDMYPCFDFQGGTPIVQNFSVNGIEGYSLDYAFWADPIALSQDLYSALITGTAAVRASGGSKPIFRFINTNSVKVGALLDSQQGHVSFYDCNLRGIAGCYVRTNSEDYYFEGGNVTGVLTGWLLGCQSWAGHYGGMTNSTIKRVHTGFAPYSFYQMIDIPQSTYNSLGSVAGLSIHGTTVRFEATGEAAIRLLPKASFSGYLSGFPMTVTSNVYTTPRGSNWYYCLPDVLKPENLRQQYMAYLGSIQAPTTIKGDEGLLAVGTLGSAYLNNVNGICDLSGLQPQYVFKQVWGSYTGYSMTDWQRERYYKNSVPISQGQLLMNPEQLSSWAVNSNTATLSIVTPSSVPAPLPPQLIAELGPNPVILQVTPNGGQQPYIYVNFIGSNNGTQPVALPYNRPVFYSYWIYTPNAVRSRLNGQNNLYMYDNTWYPNGTWQKIWQGNTLIPTTSSGLYNMAFFNLSSSAPTYICGVMVSLDTMATYSPVPNLSASQDLEVLYNNGLILNSPAANRYRLTVTDSGAIAVVNKNTGSAISQSVSDMQLTTTSATTVASVTPVAQGNFKIQVYYRVVTAATNLTIAVTYTDGSGTLQTYNIVNGGSQAVGPYSCVPVLINATPASPITVTATAGTSNNVYVSCTIKPE